MLSNYFDLIQEIETLRLEADSKAKRMKVKFISHLMKGFSISLKCGRLSRDENIQLIDYLDRSNLSTFFPNKTIEEIEQKIMSLGNWHKQSSSV